MLGFRDYTPADGELVASWVTDEWTLRVWSAACYEAWPVTGEEINRLYEKMMKKEPSFRPLMAEEDGIPVGHMCLQYTDPEQSNVHFGFVIMDPVCRGKGVGSRMLQLAIELSFGEMGAETLDLMVLDCNERAHRCYLRLGFRDVPDTTEVMVIQEKEWVRHRVMQKGEIPIIAPCRD